jgi:hypothetical protein
MRATGGNLQQNVISHSNSKKAVQRNDELPLHRVRKQLQEESKSIRSLAQPELNAGFAAAVSKNL